MGGIEEGGCSGEEFYQRDYGGHIVADELAQRLIRKALKKGAGFLVVSAESETITDEMYKLYVVPPTHLKIIDEGTPSHE